MKTWSCAVAKVPELPLAHRPQQRQSGVRDRLLNEPESCRAWACMRGWPGSRCRSGRLRLAVCRSYPRALFDYGKSRLFDRRDLPEADHEFVVIADTHYMLDVGDAPLEFESRRKQTARAGVALRLTAALGVDPVVHLGDLVQEYPETPDFDRAVDEALRQIRDTGLAPHYVAGNHDVGDKPDPTMPTHDVTGETLGEFHRRCGPSWKRVDLGPHRILILNSQILNTDLPDAARQRTWITEQLSEPTGGRTFVCLHLPLYLFDGKEQGFGHYDVIDEPDRTWLIDLIRKSEVDTIFAGHVHFAFADRIGPTDYRVLPSPSFVRPGFSHLFSSGAPPEHGRDDTPKLGFSLVRTVGERTDLHTIRTGGAETVGERSRLLTRTSAALPDSPIGVTLRGPVSPVGKIPVAYPSVIEQPVRNDYPILSCLEMGVRHVRVPLEEALDPVQKADILRSKGISVTAYHLFRTTDDVIGAVSALDGRGDALEVQFAAEDAAAFETIDEMDLPLVFCPVAPGVTVAGKQHPRTRIGWSLDGDSKSWARGRILCRVAPGDSLLDWRDCPAATSGRADFAIDLPGVSDDDNARRVAEAILALSTVPGARLFIDPLTDFDRTLDVTHGLIDTRCNPRPAMTVVRALGTILFSHGERWSLASDVPWTIVSEKRRLVLSGDVPGAEWFYGLTSGTVGERASELEDGLVLGEVPT